MQFYKFLPKPELVPTFTKSPGVEIDATFLSNALVNVLHGENVPRRTYTIGINGRGSLVMEEQEYRDLLASMILLYESQQPGYVPSKEG